MAKKIIGVFRHWKQRFDPNAVFVWRKVVIWNGVQTVPGEIVPDDLQENRVKLRTLWESGRIELARCESDPEPETDETETDETVTVESVSWDDLLGVGNGQPESTSGGESGGSGHNEESPEADSGHSGESERGDAGGHGVGTGELGSGDPPSVPSKRGKAKD